MSLVHRTIRSLYQYGPRQTVDTAIRLVVESFRDRYYTYDGLEYNIQDAILWPYGIDVWLRNGIVIDKLKEIGADKNTTILDVGAGGEGLMKIGKYSEVDINPQHHLRLDIDPTTLNGTSRGEAIIADGCAMPFEDSSFDIVVSIDSLEHVPKERRSEYISEMKRVGRSDMLLHFPMSSSDNTFVGRKSDKRYQNWHTDYFGKPEPNTEEHLSSEHPAYSELLTHFDETDVIGVQNASVWLKHMTLSKRPILRFTTGLYYYLCGKHRDQSPPYHGCFIHHKIR